MWLPFPLTSPIYTTLGVFQGALVVKNLPVNAGDLRDTGLTLGQEDPLEKEMAIHSSFLAWKMLWTEEPGRLQSMGSQESDMT